MNFSRKQIRAPTTKDLVLVLLHYLTVKPLINVIMTTSIGKDYFSEKVISRLSSNFLSGL
jgi:hypothetical protein